MNPWMVVRYVVLGILVLVTVVAWLSSREMRERVERQEKLNEELREANARARRVSK